MREDGIEGGGGGGGEREDSGHTYKRHFIHLARPNICTEHRNSSSGISG